MAASAAFPVCRSPKISRGLSSVVVPAIRPLIRPVATVVVVHARESSESTSEVWVIVRDTLMADTRSDAASEADTRTLEAGSDPTKAETRTDVSVTNAETTAHVAKTEATTDVAETTTTDVTHAATKVTHAATSEMAAATTAEMATSASAATASRPSCGR
jgi:hypothetical protein